jgi:hypothetical protein
MSRHKWKFAPTEVTRAITIAQKAGLHINRIEIGADGRIILGTGKPDEPGELNGNGSATNPWDEVLNNAADKERTA